MSDYQDTMRRSVDRLEAVLACGYALGWATVPDLPRDLVDDVLSYIRQLERQAAARTTPETS